MEPFSNERRQQNLLVPVQKMSLKTNRGNGREVATSSSCVVKCSFSMFSRGNIDLITHPHTHINQLSCCAGAASSPRSNPTVITSSSISLTCFTTAVTSATCGTQWWWHHRSIIWDVRFLYGSLLAAALVQHSGPFQSEVCQDLQSIIPWPQWPVELVDPRRALPVLVSAQAALVSDVVWMLGEIWQNKWMWSNIN